MEKWVRVQNERDRHGRTRMYPGRFETISICFL